MLRFLYLSILLCGSLDVLSIIASIVTRATEKFHKNNSLVGSAPSRDEFGDGKQVIVPPTAAPSPEAAVTLDAVRVRTRLFCVRTCDGYYFPAELPPESGIGDADLVCHKICPGAEVEVYYGDGNSEAIEDAVSQDLQNYKALGKRVSLPNRR